MNETINDVLAKDYNSCVKDLKKLDKKYNKCKEKLEAYENMRKEAINYIENTDDFDIEIFDESTGGCLGIDLSNGAKNLLNILNKVGDSNE